MTHRSLTANALFSALSWTVPAVAYIVFLPITVRGLGPDTYGVLTLLAAVAGYLGLMELGLGQAIVHSVSHHRARDEGRTVRSILRAGLTWFTAVGLVGGVVLLVCAPWIAEHVLRVPGGLLADTTLALRLTGVNFILAMQVALGSAVPQSFLRYDLGGFVQGLLGTASAVGPAVLVMTGHGLVAISLFAIVVNLCAAAVYLIVARNMLSTLDRHRGPTWREVRAGTLRFAGVQAVSRIASTLTVQSSRVVVGYAQGPASAGYFQVPNLIASRVNELLNRFATVLFPAGTRLFSVGDLASVKALYLRASRLLFLLNAGLTTGLAVVADPVLRYWVSPDYADKGAIALVVLLLTQMLWATTMPAGNMVMAAGRPGLNLKFILPSTVISLAALYPLSVRFGVTGAALAGLLGTVVVPAYLVQAHRSVVKISSMKVFRRCHLPTIVGCALAAAGGRLFLVPVCDNLILTLAVAAAVSVGAIGLSGVFGAIAREDVETGRRLARGALRRR